MYKIFQGNTLGPHCGRRDPIPQQTTALLLASIFYQFTPLYCMSVVGCCLKDRFLPSTQSSTAETTTAALSLDRLSK